MVPEGKPAVTVSSKQGIIDAPKRCRRQRVITVDTGFRLSSDPVAAPGALRIGLALCLTVALSAPAQAAPPADALAQAQRESEQLITALATSGCEFFRNGSWYAADTAAAHLRRKYEYLLDEQRIASVQDFILLAGSGSSQSGEPYRVRCGTAAPVNSAAWLNTRLAALRQVAGAASAAARQPPMRP